MPSFLTNMSGGKAIGGGALAPRSRRGNTNQVDGYWRGGGASFSVATGGTITTYSSAGKTYKSHVLSTGASAFTVVSLGDTPNFDILVVGGGGGGGGTQLGRAFGDGGGGSAGFATTTMQLPVGSYQATIAAAGTGSGGTGGTSTFGVSTSLITSVGGAGGGGCEFCYGAGGAGGSATVNGALGTSNVTTAGFTGRNGGNGMTGQTGPTNTFKDGTTLYYASTAGSSGNSAGNPAGGTGADGGASGGSGQPCSTAAVTPAKGSGGVGGTSNCGTGNAGYEGYIVVRYEVAA